MRFDGKVAIVTGGASGIGAVTCQTLAARGATVMVTDLNEAGAKENVETITKEGGKAQAYRMDITDRDEVISVVQQIVDQHGQIDILVNVAGWDIVEPFVESKPETWEKILTINLRGPINVTHAVLPKMLERNSGKIVNVSSDAGRNGSMGEAVYSSAKGGIIGFTKTIAREVARAGITVNCICPGPTDTPLFHACLADMPKVKEGLAKAIPLRRLAQPQDQANAIAFMASDLASYITGQTLSVSGGLTMM